MAVILDCNDWAQATFGTCDLGDKRLTKRLMKIGSQLSSMAGSSLAASCRGDNSSLEGSYRLIRNKKIMAKNISIGGYEATIKNCVGRNVLLAVEDSTTMAFTHRVKEQLGDLGGPKNAHPKGFTIHTTLMIDGDTEETIGLIDQKRWCRDAAKRGQRHQRSKRLYNDKESYKWEENSRTISTRLGNLMPQVVSVCDRESDIYEYIQYKVLNKQRFVIRASRDRRLIDGEGLISEAMPESELLGTYPIKIAQKYRRTARDVVIELRTKKITIKPPKNKFEEELVPLTVNVIFATEKKNSKNTPLHWVLLTTEDVSTFEKARIVTHYYELRWRIEEFHKAWKTGCGAEKQRMQESDNLEKMMVILSFVAVRLLQIKESFEKERISKTDKKEIPCGTILSKEEWKMLWFSTEKKRKIPGKAPSLGWAYHAIAKLGGWNDTKRTGKASWITIWKGWFRFQERMESYEIFKQLS